MLTLCSHAKPDYLYLYILYSWKLDGSHVNFEGSRLEDNEEEEGGQY